ncbi:SURF1 family protein [Streptacidiphilus sp. P02-A3a]|uniref:SURF1 family cytochrome oxidase biogenesis protein n=1 Tax=Streptacidiphilus sp. P02-A3a TaxID=2704468 RepID=UPI0015FB7209|nr:SURF1 family protein [Streptacidiphilus sp. P02-A3a]QMU71926.1 SURF1 family protein [Streptacidiphilus sp. P02-A3a]
MLRILLTRRWVILTLVFAMLIPVMYLLGIWQFHRYQQTNRSDAATAQNLAAAPVPIDRISRPGATVPYSEMYRHVTATGVFDVRDQYVIRNREDNSGDNEGYYLVTPLILANGDAVLIARGWVAPNGVDAAAYPSVPGTPTGTVTVFGRLAPDETTAVTGIHNSGGLPPHQAMLINSTLESRILNRPVVAGYIALVSTTPQLSSADSAQVIPGPNAASASTTDDMAVVGKGVHLPYAIQWWLFAAMVPVGWFFLFRRDVRDQRGEGRQKAEPVPVKTVAEYMAERKAAQAAAAAASGAASDDPADGAAESTADTTTPAASGVGAKE